MRWLLALIALGLALPAHAGIVATYRVGAGSVELSFEVGDNGDFRSSLTGQSRYLLAVGDSTYIVDQGRAARVSDYAIWMRERRAPVPMEESMSFTIVQSGTQDVLGRTGRAYYPDFGDGPFFGRLVWVISDDPALRPLGLAFSRHYRAGLELGENMVPFSAEAMKMFVAPMTTGTPLIGFIHMKLIRLEFRKIAPDRLVRPETLETLDQLRAGRAAQ